MPHETIDLPQSDWRVVEPTRALPEPDIRPLIGNPFGHRRAPPAWMLPRDGVDLATRFAKRLFFSSLGWPVDLFQCWFFVWFLLKVTTENARFGFVAIVFFCWLWSRGAAWIAYLAVMLPLKAIWRLLSWIGRSRAH